MPLMALSNARKLGRSLIASYSTTMTERNLFIVLSALTTLMGVLGFAAWMANGSEMFMTLVENGLAWCF
jgi:hypothetical protein